MDLTEYQMWRLLLSTYPIFYMTFIDVADKEFYIVFPGTISCAISFFIPRCKWVFRYVLPFMFLSVFNTESLIAERKTYEDISQHDSLQFLWPLICLTCFIEIKVVLKIVLHNVRRRIQFIPGTRVIVFTVYCVIHSVLFLYIFCTYVMVILNSGPYHLLHIQSRSAISVEVNPSGKLMKFDTKPKISSAVIYHLHETDQIESREKDGYAARLEGIKLPIHSRKYHRVEGEDVLLAIDLEPLRAFNIYFEESWFSVKLDKFKTSEWTIGGKLLQNDSFRNFTVQKGLKFNLTIISLTKNHFFEEIICWATTKRFSNGVLQTIKLNIASFVILPRRVEINYIFVPRGHIMYVKQIPFFTVSNVDDLSAVQHVSSISSNNDTSSDTSNTCPDSLFPFKGCGPMINLFYNMTKFISFDGHQLNSINLYETLTEGLIGLRSLSCICEPAYGIHTFTVLRTLFNTASRRYYLHETKLPYTFIVLPRGITSVAGNKYNELKMHFKDYMGSHSTDWRRPWRYFVDDENFYYYIIYKGEYFVNFFVLADMTMLIILTIKLYNKFCIRLVAKFMLVQCLPVTEAGKDIINLGGFGNDIKDLYDVMIVSSESDRNFTTQTLIPCLENKGFKICFPERDIPGGQPYISAYTNVVSSSKFFVVVGTKDFVQDKWNNEFVLQNLILPRIYELENHGHLIFIITRHPCEIPLPLRWNKYVTEIKLPEQTDDVETKAIIANNIKYVTERMQPAIQQM